MGTQHGRVARCTQVTSALAWLTPSELAKRSAVGVPCTSGGHGCMSSEETTSLQQATCNKYMHARRHSTHSGGCSKATRAHLRLPLHCLAALLRLRCLLLLQRRRKLLRLQRLHRHPRCVWLHRPHQRRLLRLQLHPLRLQRLLLCLQKQRSGVERAEALL